MTKVNLINPSVNGASSDGELFYQPAETLENITVGALVDRLESLGTWRFSFDLHKQIESEKWKKLFQLRKSYLNDLRQIPIKDL